MLHSNSSSPLFLESHFSSSLSSSNEVSSLPDSPTSTLSIFSSNSNSETLDSTVTESSEKEKYGPSGCGFESKSKEYTLTSGPVLHRPSDNFFNMQDSILEELEVRRFRAFRFGTETRGTVEQKREKIKLFFQLLYQLDPRKWQPIIEHYLVLPLASSIFREEMVDVSDWPSLVMPMLMAKSIYKDFPEDEEKKLAACGFVVVAKLVHHYWLNVRGLAALLRGIMERLESDLGWIEQTVSIMRKLLHSIAHNMLNDCSELKHNFEQGHVAWDNCFEFLQVVQDFLFFAPVRGRWEPAPKITRKTVGMHVSPEGCLDFQLVERVVDLLSNVLKIHRVYLVAHVDKKVANGQKILREAALQELQFYTLLHVLISAAGMFPSLTEAEPNIQRLCAAAKEKSLSISKKLLRPCLSEFVNYCQKHRTPRPTASSKSSRTGGQQLPSDVQKKTLPTASSSPIRRSRTNESLSEHLCTDFESKQNILSLHIPPLTLLTPTSNTGGVSGLPFSALSASSSIIPSPRARSRTDHPELSLHTPGIVRPSSPTTLGGSRSRHALTPSQRQQSREGGGGGPFDVLPKHRRSNTGTPLPFDTGENLSILNPSKKTVPVHPLASNATSSPSVMLTLGPTETINE